MILDANIGVFISYNSAGQSKLDPCGVLFDKFIDRYFPETSSQESEQPIAAPDIQSIIGTYEPSRRCETTFLAVSRLFRETKVTANLKDNTISMSGFNGLNQQPLHFREIAPMVFQEVGGKAKIAFANDASGRVMEKIGMYHDEKCDFDHPKLTTGRACTKKTCTLSD